MTCEVHVHHYNYFPFLGSTLWTPVSILIMAFSNLLLEQSLMQVAKITYFMATPWIIFFLELVLSTFSFPLRTSPCSLQSPCVLKEVTYDTLSPQSPSHGSVTSMCLRPFPCQLTRAKAIWVKFKGAQGKGREDGCGWQCCLPCWCELGAGGGSWRIFWSLFIL